MTPNELARVEKHTDRATCRTCRRAFTKDGFGQQCEADPKRCLDCYGRERAFGWQRAWDAANGVARPQELPR